jgi:hypothetical protein
LRGRQVTSEDVLCELRQRLEGGLTDLQRREIVIMLVKRITVETTVISARKKTAKITVEYAFPCVVGSHTGNR